MIALTVTLEPHHVAVHPGSSVRTSLDSVGAVSLLAKTTSLASSRRETTHFAMLVNRVTDPVNAGIVADLLVRRIDQNDFVVLHSCILVDPVAIQYTKVGVTTSNLFFGDTLKVTLELEVVDTLMPEELVRKAKRLENEQQPSK